MRYKARLCGNRRGVGTTSPKALITNIEPNSELDRDHCWIDLEAVESIMPKGHQKPIWIEFDADVKKYIKRGLEDSYTLTNITNIVILWSTDIPIGMFVDIFFLSTKWRKGLIDFFFFSFFLYKIGTKNT